MRYTQVGGARLSVIGLGTWQFGSRAWGYGQDYLRHEAVAITRRAIALGVNLIDTAEIYGFGRSERAVGAGIARQRSDAFVATKLYPLLPLAPVVVDRGVRSARRLGVDRIDLYQLHAPNPAIPLSWTMRGMADLQSRGVVDRLGVSNFDLAEWQRADGALGRAVFSNQVRYSLAVRGAEHELLPWAQANDRLVIAYSPLAQGLLSGAYDRGRTPSGARVRNPLFLPENLGRAAEMLSTLRQVATAHGATAAQVALAWLVRRGNVVAIPGARTVGQLEANAAAADLELTEEEDRWLSDVSAAFRPETTRTHVRRCRALAAGGRPRSRRSAP